MRGIVVDAEMILASGGRRAFEGPPRTVAPNRRIRRNAVRQLKRRLSWGRGPLRGRRSIGETIEHLRDPEVFDRVASGSRVGDEELVLLEVATSSRT